MANAFSILRYHMTLKSDFLLLVPVMRVAKKFYLLLFLQDLSMCENGIYLLNFLGC